MMMGLSFLESLVGGRRLLRTSFRGKPQPDRRLLADENAKGVKNPPVDKSVEKTNPEAPDGEKASPPGLDYHETVNNPEKIYFNTISVNKL
jgi:hypothetical protein